MLLRRSFEGAGLVSELPDGTPLSAVADDGCTLGVAGGTFGGGVLVVVLGGSAENGSVGGAPMSSSTTWVFANEPPAITDRWAGVAAIECTSETTGTVRRTGLVVDLWLGRLGAVRCGSAGSDRSGLIVGSLNTGTGRVGSCNAGSGALDVSVGEGLRRTNAIGPPYIAANTSTPHSDHQYRTPRVRMATSPYGFAAATDL